MSNAHLGTSRRRKCDEYYTLYSDVERELRYYSPLLRGRSIYCNCDGKDSAFLKYFLSNFEGLGLKRLVVTGYNPSGCGFYCEYDAFNKLVMKPLSGSGSFDSDECRAILGEIDIVVTNPPFSLFRSFFNMLVESGKDFLLVAPTTCYTYADVFPLLMEGRVRAGVNELKNFLSPRDITSGSVIGISGSELVKTIGTTCWVTTLSFDMRYRRRINWSRRYSPERYPRFDNFDAIDVKHIKNLPIDYTGLIGISLRYILFHNPNDYELLGVNINEESMEGLRAFYDDASVRYENFKLNGKDLFNRLIIRRKSPFV